MGEHWRRLSFPVASFPYVLFKLADMDDDAAFLTEYQRLQDCVASCKQCADLEFSHMILDFIPPHSSLQSPMVQHRVHQMRRFFQDLCIFAPLSSDAVECFHGYTQCQLHRWRGAKVSDPVAQERTTWSSICTAYAKFRDWMYEQYLDKWFFLRLACFGRSGSNQYTGTSRAKQTCHNKRPFTIQNMQRLLAFEQELPRLRKLCGNLAVMADQHFSSGLD